MKYIIKIITKGNTTQLEMSRDILDVMTRLSSYINDNYTASDFFTLGDTRHEVFAEYFIVLQDTLNAMNPKDTTVSLNLGRKQYHIFDSVVWYGINFGDDIEEFEAEHDDICDIVIPPFRII